MLDLVVKSNTVIKPLVTSPDKGTSPASPGGASEEDGRHLLKHVKLKKPKLVSYKLKKKNLLI